jgi:hypothetical protein
MDAGSCGVRIAGDFGLNPVMDCGNYSTDGAFTWTSVMEVLGNGSVGIGVSPMRQLHVHLGTDLNLWVENGGGNVRLNAANDLGTANCDFGILARSLTIQAGAIGVSYLPSSNPGAGSKQLWYDPATGHVMYSA